MAAHPAQTRFAPPILWRISATTAGLEAALLIGYAASIAFVAATSGIEGPQDVSSPVGVVVEVATFALLGAGVAVIAVGRWRGTDWSRVPFVMVQLLALVTAVPMAFGSGAGVPAGVVVSVAATVGLAALVAGAVLAPAANSTSETDRTAARHQTSGTRPRMP